MIKVNSKGFELVLCCFSEAEMEFCIYELSQGCACEQHMYGSGGK